MQWICQKKLRSYWRTTMAEQKAYYVSVQIYNTFYIAATSEEDAENQVRELDCYATLDECNLNIASIDEILQEDNDG